VVVGDADAVQTAGGGVGDNIVKGQATAWGCLGVHVKIDSHAAHSMHNGRRIKFKVLMA
jgi:hypothetical protein